MKKTMEKIISVALAVISLFFVILILVTMYGGISMDDLSNKLVRALIFIMFGAFMLLSGFNIWATFIDDEKLSDVLLFKDRESATKATVGVVKKTAKRVCKQVEEARIRKVILHSDASGNISMNIAIKVTSDETMDVITKVRALLIETFSEVFGIEFASINFKVVKSKNTFVPTDKDVDAKVKELKASVKTNKLPENKVQTSTVTGDVPSEEKEEVIEVVEATEETVTESEEQLREIQAEIYEAEDAAIDRKAAKVAVEEEIKDSEEAEETPKEDAQENAKVAAEEEIKDSEEAEETPKEDAQENAEEEDTEEDK